jgi:hypothetical protein
MQTVHRHPQKKTVDGGIPAGENYESTPSKEQEPVPLRALLTKPVMLSIANYSVLALLDIALAALLPLFCATPIELGGLGLQPALIGLCLGTYGLMAGVLHALFLAGIVRRFGARRVFVTGMSLFMPIFAIFPFINLVARKVGISYPVYMMLVLQLVLMVIMDMAFSTFFISRELFCARCSEHSPARLHIHLYNDSCAE